MRRALQRSLCEFLPPRTRCRQQIDTTKKPPILKISTSSAVDFSGIGLEAVTKARLGEKDVQFAVYGAGNAIIVIIDGSLITSPGKQEIEFETKAGPKLTAPVLVIRETANE